MTLYRHKVTGRVYLLLRNAFHPDSYDLFAVYVKLWGGDRTPFCLLKREFLEYDEGEGINNLTLISLDDLNPEEQAILQEVREGFTSCICYPYRGSNT